jgi:hypothetical protein
LQPILVMFPPFRSCEKWDRLPLFCYGIQQPRQQEVGRFPSATWLPSLLESMPISLVVGAGFLLLRWFSSLFFGTQHGPKSYSGYGLILGLALGWPCFATGFFFRTLEERWYH